MLAGLWGLAIAQSLYYYSRLSPVMASHFAGAGEPNAWSSRPGFFVVYFGVLILAFGIFAVLPRYFDRSPGLRLNLPNRDHWLGSERRESTLRHIRTQFLWLGNANTALAVFVVQLVIHANLGDGRISVAVLWALGAYAVVVIVWLGCFVLKYARAP